MTNETALIFFSDPTQAQADMSSRIFAGWENAICFCVGMKSSILICDPLPSPGTQHDEGRLGG